jgi:DNA-binding NarL/FixJ family response regulator
MFVTIAIADDHILFRKGMIQLIQTFENMKVIVEAENGKTLLERLELLAYGLPHVLLLDISMPEMNGIDAFLAIRKKYPGIKTIMLSMHKDESHIITMIKMGVNGYLVKNADPEEVKSAILKVMETEYYFNESTMLTMQKGLFKKKHELTIDYASDLTDREREVLRLICKELTTAEIAGQLFLSRRTVDGHRNNLLLKTGARNTAGLVLFAVKANIVSF